jgi:hypothetical protein
MTPSIEIDDQGGHQYVVRLQAGEDVCESWFNITPAVLEHLRAQDQDEEQVVRRTAEFLTQRQEVVDFPEIVELEDVIATYDDYVPFMTR